MRELDYSVRPPLTPAQLSRALVDAARQAQVKRKLLPGMSPHKQQQAELFRTVIADWYTFLLGHFDPNKVGDQLVEINSKSVHRQAVSDLRLLKFTDRSRQGPYFEAALGCKKAELQCLKYIDRLTSEWTRNMSDDASRTIATLNREYLGFTGKDALTVLRHGYGSATNTYWGLVGVGEKLRAVQGAGPTTAQSRVILSESAVRISLVLSSLHMEHLRAVDLTLRGESSVADYRPCYFNLSGDALLVRQSAALLKLPETGTSIATGCPAATTQVEGHGNVASGLLRLFEHIYRCNA